MKCKYGDSGCVYAFGVDPAWHISGNELLFFNSMKMKMSVILGIIQMGVGVFLKGLNATYFKQPVRGNFSGERNSDQGKRSRQWLPTRPLLPTFFFFCNMTHFVRRLFFCVCVARWTCTWRCCR